MVADTRIANAQALVACDGIVDAIDVGTAAAAGKVEIRSGAPPADVETAPSGTLLVLIAFNNPAFNGATDQTPGARATMDATPAVEQTSATSAGTAGWFRVYDRGTATPLGIWQNTVGGTSSGEGMELSNVNIAAGQQVTITSWNFDVPET
jgi:hypothetical protein